MFFFKLAAFAAIVSVSLYLILRAMTSMMPEVVIHAYLAMERRDFGEHPFFFAVVFAFVLSRAVAVILALVAVTKFVLTL